MLLKHISLLFFVLMLSCNDKGGTYVCPPCDLECDKLVFKETGNCPHCKMTLIKKTELETYSNLEPNEIEFEMGSGLFLVEGGIEKSKSITMHYHMPKNFTINSKVIFVLPGAGRNGKDYRNAWIEQSEKYGLLVLSLEYPENHYLGFWNYNLAGMIHDVDVEKKTFKINKNPNEWIFGDFDRIFDLIKVKLNLKKDKYDMFGHSAGGQILHRLSLFKPDNNADRILASNSGWYTVPTDLDSFPYGLKNIELSTSEIDFTSKLTIFLGEKDDENETRGHLRHSPEVDKQGLDRISRGRYFYSYSKTQAEKTKKEFNWKIEIVPNVGHDYEEMSKWAAEYLYRQ
ncbi:hypothetical protein ACFSQJ_17915 [Croceitalea marina]|uniref:Alpha/beta hydrolase n=1 Tax=Croceitalea marina TaxID=1775166 RepID=A0ABW5N0X7_9FLAO